MPKSILSESKCGLIYEDIFNLAPSSKNGTKSLSLNFSNQIKMKSWEDSGFISFLGWDQNENNLWYLATFKKLLGRQGGV